MNIDKKKIYILSASAFVASVLVCFISQPIIRRYMAALAACIVSALVLVLIKKRTELSIAKKQILWLLPLIAVFAVSLLYISGIKFGYYTQSVKLSVLWYSVIPYLIIIVGTEFARSVLLMQNDKLVGYLSYLTFLIFEVAMLVNNSHFATFNQWKNAVGLVILPAISASILYHYISKRYGAAPVILYRAVIALYKVLLPISARVPESLLAFSYILLPILVLLFVEALYAKRKYAVSRQTLSVRNVMTGALLVFMTMVIMLISCRFKYGMLVIATDSMTGSIDKGDAVIYKSYDGGVVPDQTVVVFEKDGVTFIHRIVESEYIDGEIRYYTKGDANDLNDTGYITEKNIVGTTDLRIKYIGYPTLWMRYLFK